MSIKQTSELQMPLCKFTLQVTKEFDGAACKARQKLYVLCKLWISLSDKNVKRTRSAVPSSCVPWIRLCYSPWIVKKNTSPSENTQQLQLSKSLEKVKKLVTRKSTAEELQTWDFGATQIPMFFPEQSNNAGSQEKTQTRNHGISWKNSWQILSLVKIFA